ncbi:MAG: hypothetical protein EXR27_02190 [Betaproteobacteria bacterium]|nr:hypothetical protein [Betaproteobacteria bacterium]
MATHHLRTKYLLPSAALEELRRDVTIEYESAAIKAIDHDATIGVAAGANTLVMPPLANAHDHGRGLKTLAYGASDAAVEAWVPATYTLPPLDPYLVAAAALGRMARSGIGSCVHCHLSRDPATLVREAKDVSRAAREIGIRVAFVVPLRDRHRLGLGADEDVLACLAPADAEAVRSRWLKPVPPMEQQLATVDEIAGQCESGLFQVQFGPVGVEWCSDPLLEKIAARSAASGRRVHMHLLESKYQRQWADHAFPRGIVQHLKSLGLLSARLTVAHGTWLRADECGELAAHGVTVSINTSSNLRLRSGVAPLRDMHAAGLNFAIGLDSLAIDDDDDVFREMRLAYLMHRGTSFDQVLSRSDLLTAATRNGAQAASARDCTGEIAVGHLPDMLTLGLDRITADLGPGLYDLLQVCHARARAADVTSLIVAGREIVASGRLLGIDLESIEHALIEQLRGHAGSMAEFRPLLLRYQAGLERFYRNGGHMKQQPQTRERGS